MTSPLPSSVDAIVLGLGAGGAVLAARLSELADVHVLGVEAGPDYPPSATLPPDLRDGTRNSMSRHDWGYRHRPMPRTLPFPLPRGRVVGGSSAVNTCIALRGQPWDYDTWRDLGLDGWGWDDCLPAFRRLERDLDRDDPWHGTDGPLPVRRFRPDELEPWQARFVEAAEAMGFPACPDSNAPHSTGVGPHAMNQIDGRRVSAAEAWLTAEVRARPNLHLLAKTTARRVLWSGDRVDGVELVGPDGAAFPVRAKRVFVCAGAIETPRFLLASGLGPESELRRLGVPARALLPAVGRRLLDHPGTAIFLRPRKGWWRRHPPLIQTVCRFDSGQAGGPNDLLMQPGSTVPVGARDLPLLSLMMQVGSPKGEGRITYHSTEAGGAVTIDSQLFAHAEDRRMALVALERMAELLDRPEVRAVVTPIVPLRPMLRRPALLDRFVQHVCGSGYHPSGTAPMGTSAETGAADARGRVFGVEGLWIADASLMPTIPTSNIHIPTLMMAERIAEFARLSIRQA